MKDGQLFRVKVIHSEEDLPKRIGNYFFGSKNPNRFDSCKYGVIHYYTSKEDEIFWMKEVDWYLIPEEITDSDIEVWAKKEAEVEIEDENGKYIKIDSPLAEYFEIGAKAVLNNEIKHIK